MTTGSPQPFSVVEAKKLGPGDRINDRYEIVRRVGEGGFAIVYEANDTQAGGRLAIKVLSQDKSTSEFGERFRQEVFMVRQLAHPNTIKIWDAGTTQHGSLFMAMEFVAGVPLNEFVKTTGAVPLPRALHIIKQVLKSLSEAHSLGIIHRDLKPANIMVCEVAGEKDYVKVLDFGIAKALDTGLSRVQTQTGVLMCTPAYAAPELLRAQTIAPATDIYSVGLIMGELLTGSAFVDGPSLADLIAKQLSTEPVPVPPDLSMTPIGPILQKATAKPLDQRFQNAGEMLEALENFQAYQSQAIPQQDFSHQAGPLVATPPKQGGLGVGGRIAIVAVFAFLALAVVFFLVTSGGDDPSGNTVATQNETTTESPTEDDTTLAVTPDAGTTPSEVETNTDDETTLAVNTDQPALDAGSTAAPNNTENADVSSVLAVIEDTGQPSFAGEGTGAGELMALPDAGTILVVADVGEGTGAIATVDDADAGGLAASIDGVDDTQLVAVAQGDVADEIAIYTIRLVIDSDPDEAHLYMDDEEIGETPFDGVVESTEESVSFRLRRRRYETERFTVDMTAGLFEGDFDLDREEEEEEEEEEEVNPFGHTTSLRDR